MHAQLVCVEVCTRTQSGCLVCCSVLGSAFFHEEAVLQGGQSIVLVRDIDFASTSEETLLPFHGRCHIGYVPAGGVVLGLSKLARLTRVFAKRLQTQERLGVDIANALQRHLHCHGCAVIIEARHLTMGSEQPPELTTACLAGRFSELDSGLFEVGSNLPCVYQQDCVAVHGAVHGPVPTSCMLCHLGSCACSAITGSCSPAHTRTLHRS